MKISTCCAALLGAASLLAAGGQARALSVIDVATETLILAQTIDALAIVTLLGPDFTAQVDLDFSVAPGLFGYGDTGGQSYGGSPYSSSGVGSYDELTGLYSWLTSSSGGGTSWAVDGGGTWAGDETEKETDGEVVLDVPGPNDITVKYTTKIFDGFGGTRSTGSYEVTFSGSTVTYAGLDKLKKGKWTHYLDIPELDPDEYTPFFITVAGLSLAPDWPVFGGDGTSEFRVTEAPVPAALPLLFGALGLLGLARRRSL